MHESPNVSKPTSGPSTLPARATPWQARLAWLVLCTLGLLPLRALHVLGSFVGQLLRWLPSRERRIATQNIAVCFPEASAAEQRQLLHQSLQQTAQSLLELPKLWTMKAPTALIRQVHGQELLQAALAARRPIIFAAPHLGAWEALNLWLAEQTPLLILYRAPRIAWLESVLNRCRGRTRATPLRAEPQAVRALLKHLQAGGAVGILPDQKPKLGEGEYAPFFGIDTLTMTLLPKLAVRTNATVIFAYAERLPRAAGFAIHLRSAQPLVQDGTTLNRNLESCARLLPAQYQWTYKRFSMQPEGSVDVYRTR
jgi:Kdo2-lipid IVA lauroyltransferase/acyltransferase